MSLMKAQAFLDKARGEVVKPLVPSVVTDAEIHVLAHKIKQTLELHDAVLITHYYCSPELQKVTELCDGFIGDSLEMAKFGKQHKAKTLIIGGVKFMGESAKILSPEKTVLMPDLEATCSLDVGCPEDEFKAFCEEHSERTVVVYANTSAKVKALADWVVTSSIAVPILEYLHENDEKVLWAPDKHLGSYLQKVTEADMLLWDGSCIVHDTFKANTLSALKEQHPNAAVLVHPESPKDVVEMADIVGSTSQLLNATKTLDNQEFIVATERGIFYKMQQASPEKTFIQAPSGGHGATCQSCVHCPWMALNDVEAVIKALENPVNHEIHVDSALTEQALVPLNRMLEFASTHLQKKSA